MESIYISKVSKENWKRACRIKMKPEQESLLAPVEYCLARAYINPYKEPIEPYVIYLCENIIGFFWFTFVDSGVNCVLCGFRIDKDYQGLGYSKMALNAIIQMLKNEYLKCEVIQVFVEISNTPSKNLLKKFEFDTLRINKESDLELMAYRLKPAVEIQPICEDCLNDE